MDDFKSLIKIEKIYQEAFGKDGTGKLYLKMWSRIKNEFDIEPEFIEVLWRISVEEILFLIIAKEDKERFINMQKLNKEILGDNKLNLNDYYEIEKFYAKEFKTIRKYFRNKNKK